LGAGTPERSEAELAWLHEVEARSNPPARVFAAGGL